MPHWLSDALCRLATGGSFAVRQLYTDDEEVLFEATRPILLNGIEDVISRPDLGDRGDISDLGTHSGDRPASGGRAVEAIRNRAPPRILGALLDAVVQGLRAVNYVQLAALPRMADFALWAAACETAFWPAGTFARAYAANRRAAVESIIEADPLADCVRTMMRERTSWTGSASDLLRLCAEGAREDALVASPPWAKNSRDDYAGRRTFLRMLGIEMTFAREGRSGARIIRLSALGQSDSSAVGMDRNDGQNERYRVNGEGWVPPQSSTPHGVEFSTVSIVSTVRVIRPRAQFGLQRGSPRAMLTVLTQEVALPVIIGRQNLPISSAPR